VKSRLFIVAAAALSAAACTPREGAFGIRLEVPVRFVARQPIGHGALGCCWASFTTTIFETSGVAGQLSRLEIHIRSIAGGQELDHRIDCASFGCVAGRADTRSPPHGELVLKHHVGLGSWDENRLSDVRFLVTVTATVRDAEGHIHVVRADMERPGAP
jgi:hypothetical protein